ncbi:MAG: hypothetical protein H7257_07125 [Taibaiella sp.]|nr:hypothetical protein [Taibaiella sp.]
MSNTIVIPPGGSYGRANPNHVATLGPGYATITFPFSLALTTTFRWTDATFQTDCFGVCFNSSGNLEQGPLASTCGGNGATGIANWTGPYCMNSATWFPNNNIPMRNVVIDLY